MRNAAHSRSSRRQIRRRTRSPHDGCMFKGIHWLLDQNATLARCWLLHYGPRKFDIARVTFEIIRVARLHSKKPCRYCRRAKFRAFCCAHRWLSRSLRVRKSSHSRSINACARFLKVHLRLRGNRMHVISLWMHTRTFPAKKILVRSRMRKELRLRNKILFRPLPGVNSCRTPSRALTKILFAQLTKRRKFW